ncbi:hypothetical protein DDB_G0289565 [Dictyostelium discoideum AX4]|nr:hypothetical protein DDB_G0289565 [Dictyostelium discoideum AX4]EAL62657.1 hypothetical protein DDB_G0289565 [Dictyostelium discoideum AX4]|eukprot:XP_636160.1 hypothetical protein DDB_G0289565 [Dictyostelium discoideum AX4]
MISNNNNNRICTLHPNRFLMFFCLDCQLIPCCAQCTSVSGEHHGHKTNE